jgi:hypothetical protein
MFQWGQNFKYIEKAVKMQTAAKKLDKFLINLDKNELDIVSSSFLLDLV